MRQKCDFGLMKVCIEDLAARGFFVLDIRCDKL